jgi:hypothetical protein
VVSGLHLIAKIDTLRGYTGGYDALPDNLKGAMLAGYSCPGRLLHPRFRFGTRRLSLSEITAGQPKEPEHEIELRVLARQRLGQRLPDLADLRREVIAWETARNAAGEAIDWRFTTADARIKLKRLYPTDGS